MGKQLEDRLAEVGPVLENWWNHGDQPDPLILATASDSSPETVSSTSDLTRYWTDVDWIVERQMQTMNSTEYFGVALPFHYVDQGASAMAGVLGAHMELVDETTIWAYPMLDDLDQLLSVQLDSSNPVYHRIRSLTKASVALARNHHFVAPYALEGAGDIAAALYGTTNLLMDMVTKPARVARALEHLKRIWIHAFDDIWAEINVSGNPGGIGWAGIWAPGTTFPLQEDFSYMISPDMFRRYCLPHIRDQIDAMEYGFYHLDGVGAIGHLDALLEIEKLRVIQWVPGAGKESLKQWHPLIRRILAAGKSVEVFAEPDEIDDLVSAVGARGLLVSVQASRSEAEKVCSRYAF